MAEACVFGIMGGSQLPKLPKTQGPLSFAGLPPFGSSWQRAGEFPKNCLLCMMHRYRRACFSSERPTYKIPLFDMVYIKKNPPTNNGEGPNETKNEPHRRYCPAWCEACMNHVKPRSKPIGRFDSLSLSINIYIYIHKHIFAGQHG